MKPLTVPPACSKLAEAPAALQATPTYSSGLQQCDTWKDSPGDVPYSDVLVSSV